MKNKLFTKLGIAALGIAMAVVTGTAIQNAATEAKAADETVAIKFGSASGSVNFNSSPKEYTDSQNTNWTFTVAGTTSFTANASYSQLGSSNKPASSITLTGKLSQSSTISSLETKWGGFKSTAGTITMKVGDTTVGSGKLNATNDVTVKSTTSGESDTISITVSGIAKGVKLYYINYTILDNSGGNEPDVPTASISNLTVVTSSDEDVVNLDANSENSIQDDLLYEVEYNNGDIKYDVEITSDNTNGITITDDKEGNATLTFTKNGTYHVTVKANETYQKTITYNITGIPVPAATKYTLVKSDADLEIGLKYLIASTSTPYAFVGAQNSNNRAQFASQISDESFELEGGQNDIAEITLGGIAGAYTLHVENTEDTGFLYAASSSKNYLRTRVQNDDDNSKWSIVVENKVATIKATGTYTNNWLRYNSSSKIFSCYASGQGDVCLFKEVKAVDTNKILEKIQIKDGTSLTKTEFIEGTTFVPYGLTIEAVYTDPTTYPNEDITNLMTWSNLKLEDTTATGTYIYNDTPYTITIENITVKEKSLSRLSIANTLKSLMVGQEFTLGENAVITITYDNDVKEEISATHENIKITMDRDTENPKDITNGYTFVESDIGEHKITVSYTYKEETRQNTYDLTIVKKVNQIEHIYSLNKDDTYSFDGYYAGSYADGVVVMDGEFGILLYKAEASESWVIDETVLHVEGKVKIYNNLYEIAEGCTVTVQTNEAKINDVEKPQNYALTGEELDTQQYSLANRRTFVTGTLKSIQANYNNYNIVVTNTNGADIPVYLKSTDNVNNVVSGALADKVGKNVTIKAFTSFHTNFQARACEVIAQDETYTIEQFSQELLDLTSVICSNGTNDNKESLVELWNLLGGETKWQTLTITEQDEFRSVDKTPCYSNDSEDVVENAIGRYNYICKKYQLTNFAGRTDIETAPTLSLSNTPTIEQLSNNNTPTIFVVTIIALSFGTVTIFLSRKRKHN